MDKETHTDAELRRCKKASQLNGEKTLIVRKRGDLCLPYWCCKYRVLFVQIHCRLVGNSGGNLLL